MTYSFVIPYYKRRQFWNTLVSYDHFMGGRNDVEFLVLEDKKNIALPDEHSFLITALTHFEKRLCIRHIPMNYDNYSCPCQAINHGVDTAAGKYVVMTNPECFLSVDVRLGFEEEFAKSENIYVVCSCLSVISYSEQINSFEEFKYKGKQWYQHPARAPRNLNFCTALTKEAYVRMGGFNEEYDKGIGRADVDFVSRVSRNLKIVTRDDLLVLHQNHDISFPLERRLELININRGCGTFKSRFGKG